MNKRFFRDLLTRRSNAWTFGLCLTGVLVIGTIVAMNSTQISDFEEPETTMEQAYLEDGDYQDGGEAGLTGGIGDMILADADSSSDGTENAMDVSSGNAVEDLENTAQNGEADDSAAGNTEEAAGDTASAEENGQDQSAGDETAEAASANVISEEALLAANVAFDETDTLLWPAAGTILIDYSMDGSVYFPTLDQYKYNPALIIGSEAGNQVVSAARGIVESLDVDEVNGLKMTVNIGNGYRLVYGQLKEAAAAQGDLVEAGSVIGYVSEPTRFYSREGSNLYFQMTKDQVPVDPILYLE